ERRARHRLVCIGQPGHFARHLGIDTAILALQALPDSELVVGGGPPAEQIDSDPEARRLLDLAERAQVADRVRLLGALDRAEVPALVRSADIVVSVPSYVPYGTAVLEAMACGRAVVAS